MVSVQQSYMGYLGRVNTITYSVLLQIVVLTDLQQKNGPVYLTIYTQLQNIDI